MPRRRTVVAVVATVCVLAPPAWLWQASLLPASYAATAMGYHDEGAGRPVAEHHHATTDAGTR
jgi:hypothetical protein